jgi:2-aminophenol/2-amino-5-chlorophenol 1,6-dioxygenase alpha subunit
VSVVAAALVPGMPQLLAAEPAPSWAELAAATREVGDRLRRLDVQAVLLLSTQWFTVLGHQVQCDARLRGTRTDENWYRYDYGHLTHDLAVDVELAHAWADAIDAAGMQARRTRYEGFPVDTGTVTASKLLDPTGAGRWAIVSCNLYADPSAMGEVARAGVRAAGDRRVAVVAVSGLSSGLIPRWITPAEDAFENAEHDRWNRKVLDAVRAGTVTAELGEEYSRAAQVDSQFRAHAFLAGSGAAGGPGEVLAYGPVWGTGAAVVWWGPDGPSGGTGGDISGDSRRT